VANIYDKLIEWGALYGTKIIGAIAILVLGRILVGVLAGIVRRLLRKASIDDTLARFLTGLTKGLLYTFVIVAAISTLGVETTSFVAVLGAAGLAVGFALQGSLSNFAAGVMLIAFRPFRAGDYVEAGGTAGSVEEVGIFTTVLKTPDNKKVIIPNSKITSDTIINYSAKETRRLDLVFGIGYEDDIKKARQVLQDIIAQDERILKDPAPTIAVLELGDSSVNFAVRPWVKTPDYWPVYFDLTEKVKLTCDANDISIPFPQRDVHVHQIETVKAG
jgi:small conductance mechanosensitive channel